MEEGAHGIRLVSEHGDGSDLAEGDDLGLTTADLEAAQQLAEFHRLLAAELPPRSQVRGLVLRCAGHWSRLGSIPHNGLAEVDRRDRD